MKPVVLGALAAWAAKVPAMVGTLAGLGYLFTDTKPRTRALRLAITPRCCVICWIVRPAA